MTQNPPSTTALPRPLRPWSAFLARLDPGLAEAIGPWLPRILAAMGTLKNESTALTGEPDGLGGLTRRGPFHRLVPAQWALADVLPDEFLRRAAQSELLFYDRAHRQRRGQPRVVLLLDAGPEQVGAPRLAQLAWLVVHARRAEEAGGALSWGILQAPGELFHSTAPRILQQRFLEGGREHGRPPRRDHLDRWLAALSAPERAGLWLAGGSALVDRPDLPPCGVVRIHEPLDPDDRALRLLVRPRRASPRRLSLSLPDPTDCARLLRDPFHVSAAPTRHLDVRLAYPPTLRFAPNGRRLLARLDDGTVAFFAVPGSPREPVGHHRFVPAREGEQLIAAGWHRRRPLTVWSRDDDLIVRGLGDGSLSVPAEPGRAWHLPYPATASLRPAFGWGKRRERGVAFLNGTTVWSVHQTPTGLTVQPIADNVADLVWHRGRLAWVGRSSEAIWSLEAAAQPDGHRDLLSFRAILSRRVPHVSWSSRSGSGRTPPYARHPGEGAGSTQDWHIARHSRPLRLHPDAQVAGLTQARNAAGDNVIGLVAIEADRLGLRFVGHEMNRRILRPREPIVAAAVASAEATVAILTEGGSLTVFSLDFRAPLLRLETGAVQ